MFWVKSGSHLLLTSGALVQPCAASVVLHCGTVLMLSSQREHQFTSKVLRKDVSLLLQMGFPVCITACPTVSALLGMTPPMRHNKSMKKIFVPLLWSRTYFEVRHLSKKINFMLELHPSGNKGTENLMIRMQSST